MRFLSILFAGLLSLSAGSAFAADAVANPPVESINWSGAYIGIEAGYGWGGDSYQYFSDDPVHVRADGFIGGVTAGYNWQRDHLVFGVEGDISYSAMKGSTHTDVSGPPCRDEGCTATVDWFGTGRARVGYAFENFLPYATGGFAVGHVKGSADLGACLPAGSCDYSDTRWGWTAGAGVEWAMNQQISLKAEYLHVDLGAPDFTRSSVTTDAKFDTARIGMNYHF
ncbi:outer membrane protein [Mesorhizobium sp.]|uniref:outer membrane protein n=1 Tax=Mesorhizobium sp. TaxID=1871066 RepID=UPI0025D607F3|nr:outer membrane protein [Mesorhizobium sp.]